MEYAKETETMVKESETEEKK
ncbi:hypothetical protein Tco_0694660, partial [Tanacetum coccineum]